MRIPTLPAVAGSVFCLLTVSGCGLLGGGNPGLGAEARTITVPISSPGGASTGVSGTATFTELEDGVYFSYEITGLTPGDHGFHVHENASCAAADTDGDGAPEAGGAAGGHFNPMGSPHGAPSDDPDMRHAGDLGNTTADDQGEAYGGREDPVLTFDGDTSLMGRALVVHSQADDFTSQPGGDAGDRVGCGVIPSM